MTESSGLTRLTADDAKEIRRITHDINNALEVIVQASYLVNMTELSGQAKEWMKLLDTGVQQATDLNRQMRDFVRARS
ncbi:MAG: hypothetical protein JWM54_1457 [Acidobacteriaceae bacterium]|jgi:hypothetical protein|nr:hypothetical protein [Acidobacteriaceae bacterium]